MNQGEDKEQNGLHPRSVFERLLTVDYAHENLSPIQTVVQLQPNKLESYLSKNTSQGKVSLSNPYIDQTIGLQAFIPTTKDVIQQQPLSIEQTPSYYPYQIYPPVIPYNYQHTPRPFLITVPFLIVPTPYQQNALPLTNVRIASIPFVPPPTTSVNSSVNSRKRPQPLASSPSSQTLQVFINYLRKQYAFCPRWWFLFRFVISRIQQSTTEQKVYVKVLNLLLAGRKKERKLLGDYLCIDSMEGNETVFDKCFDKRKLTSTIPLLLNCCEECIALSDTRFKSALRTTYVQSNRNEQQLKKMEDYYAKRYELFILFVSTLDTLDTTIKYRVIKILDEYLEQFLAFGYFDSDVLYETLYSTIYNSSTAVQSFKLLMDSSFHVSF